MYSQQLSLAENQVTFGTDFAEGLYLLTVTDKNAVKTFKIIKTK